jgi:LacI family transcriptional regulator
MRTKKRVTIKEVAQAAGVSTQTVSRVLNDRPDVSTETRERIREIITDLGYSPNVLARSLIQGRSHTLGVVGYGLRYFGPSRVLTGIERRSNELGYSILLSLLRDLENNDGVEVFRNLLDRQVDGIIWAVPEIGSNREWIAEQLNHISCPVVFINMQPVRGVPVVAIDNCAGGRMATEHLLNQGYRRIGLITGPESWWEAREREKGWQEAMIANGIASEELASLKVNGDWYPSSGETGLEELLRRRPDLEAVFACNDPMAAGALQAARRFGRRVPEDLAIIGFDDTPESAYYFPTLSTIRQPLLEVGGQAVTLLHEIFESSMGPSEVDSSRVIWIQPDIVIRDSSRRES